ncbi:hypothetical protein [Rhizorhabdus sp.]|uniref:hypothetical protein n=1 Tax=Rhizorhabdus sp. TaxID=1968843 RepID=UPI001992C3AB|nr:hypothetical protein [Rhizorhabdus sp.]MBD3762608.1 hypothetical protein [Rhizorhabdus sp.]
MADEMLQAARLVELEGLVREFGEQFRFYEASHRAKGTPDADAKADVNDMLASRAEAALRGDTAFRAPETAPDNAPDLIIALVIKCCHPGARLLTIGDRYEGRWVFPIEHEVDVIGWAPAPAFPEILMGGTRQ